MDGSKKRDSGLDEAQPRGFLSQSSSYTTPKLKRLACLKSELHFAKFEMSELKF